jgi:hypothetical protein
MTLGPQPHSVRREPSRSLVLFLSDTKVDVVLSPVSVYEYWPLTASSTVEVLLVPHESADLLTDYFEGS